MEKKKIDVKCILIALAIITVCLVADLLTKWLLADKLLKDGSDILLIPGLFNLTYVKNTGAAFGMFSGNLTFLIILTVVFVIIFILMFLYFNHKNLIFLFGYGMIFAGALGNFVDRIFLGYVRDFIQFDFWRAFPVFNLADTFLTFGIILIVLYLIIHFIKEEKSKTKEK